MPEALDHPLLKLVAAAGLQHQVVPEQKGLYCKTVLCPLNGVVPEGWRSARTLRYPAAASTHVFRYMTLGCPCRLHFFEATPSVPKESDQSLVRAIKGVHSGQST